MRARSLRVKIVRRGGIAGFVARGRSVAMCEGELRRRWMWRRVCLETWALPRRGTVVGLC